MPRPSSFSQVKGGVVGGVGGSYLGSTRIASERARHGRRQMILVGAVLGASVALLLVYALNGLSGPDSGPDGGVVGSNNIISRTKEEEEEEEGKVEDMGGETTEDPSANAESNVPWRAAVSPRPGKTLSARGCRKLHYIHVGKSGGTSLIFWTRRVLHHAPPVLLPRGEPALELHPHSFVLGDAAEPGDCYAFFVRDPVERWVSGYYSHYRKMLNQPQKLGKKGKDRKQKLWALKRFEDVNKLGEALSSHDNGERRDALKVHKILGHCRQGYAYYLPRLHELIEKVAFVGVTHQLDTDFVALMDLAGLPTPEGGVVAAGWTAAHTDPNKLAVKKSTLSPLARANLEHLLIDDYSVMGYLREKGFTNAVYKPTYA